MIAVAAMSRFQGVWPGPPGEATQWPSTMEIDHIKIWKYNGPDA